jgi:hypothetical protein
MNTTTRPESMALAQIPAPAALPAGTTSASALMLSGDSMDKMMRIADFMASAKATIPQHLRNPGDCLAVVMQATQWNMNPFAVAQKTHLVNGTLGYEAQLVAAVINNSGLVADRFNFEWFGAWEKIVGKFKEVESRTKKDDNGNPKKYIVPAWDQKDEHGLGVRVWATIKGESEPRVLELLMTQARTRNSTLWTEDPKQQIAYLAQKRWARLYAPDVIMGVYTPDELENTLPRDMGTAEVVSLWTPEQMTAADEAAAKGSKAYVGFWKSLGPEVQAKLAKTPEHDRFKADAQRADAARTVDAPAPAAAPAPAPATTDQGTGEITTTVADVRARMEAAKSEDALYVAYDWSNALTEADQQAHGQELDAMFDARLKAIRGEA